MALSNFRLLIHELLNKDPDIVPEEYPLVIFYIKSDVYINNNGKYIKNTIHIVRRVDFLRNGEK